MIVRGRSRWFERRRWVPFWEGKNAVDICFENDGNGRNLGLADDWELCKRHPTEWTTRGAGTTVTCRPCLGRHFLKLKYSLPNIQHLVTSDATAYLFQCTSEFGSSRWNEITG